MVREHRAAKSELLGNVREILAETSAQSNHYLFSESTDGSDRSVHFAGYNSPVGQVPPTGRSGNDPVALFFGGKGKPASTLQAIGYVGDSGVDGDTAGAPTSTEAYARIDENPFLDVAHNPLSTFSIDVDTASYSNVRRFLNGGQLPPKDAVRIEELLNYFVYDYPQPAGDAPFGVDVEIADCPWNAEHRLARIGLAGRDVPAASRPASNLVFLIDVSGSMNEPNKLPLVKRSLRLLLDRLDERDRVALVVYAGNSGLVLPSTSCGDKASIASAIDRLDAGGSTNGAEGIELAYDVASKGKIPGGINRVILATDGDFNVGVTNEGDLTRLIEEKAKSGVFLSALGFGMGNIKDATLQKLADRGNGNYAYIDSLAEAQKVLVEQMGATLQTIAKDVKIQVEFNPAVVSGYRLLGYEKRMLRQEDFNDDAKDAGEIGAGHTVTALYEVVPAGKTVPTPAVDPLKYQPTPIPGATTGSADLLTVKLRYKDPEGDASRLLEQPVVDSGSTLDRASDDFRFAAAVASFAMVLRGSPNKGSSTFDSARDLASGARGRDAAGYRAEFLGLVEKARAIAPSPDRESGR
ncbi:MAG: VWA domain-containing protein [Planctomycetes bacterium]|nr:VWA domain-containing protein [Planctomycetota bacterium]MBI3846192.1 VWA domain-containing protein [Planctomycetota bacterium]